MNHLSRFLATALVLTTAFQTNAQNRKISFEHGKWAEVLEKAKKENKMIYLDCYTSWCGPCKWMAKNVFTNDTAADFYNNAFVNVEMDMEKGEGLELAKKYGIQAYPTMLYLNPAGEVMHRTCGSGPVQTFVKEGKDAQDPEKQLASKKKKFANGNVDGNIALEYISALERGCQNYDAELSAYFASQKEEALLSRVNWDLLYRYASDYSSKEFAYLEKNKAAYEKLYSKDSVEGKINRIYSSGIMMAIRKKDDASYQSLKTKIKQSGIDGAEEIIMDADMRYFKAKGDWSNYAAIAVKHADSHLKNDPMGLNSIAWDFYENIEDKAMLEKALVFAKSSVEQQSMYANMDTYAALLYKLGHKAEAKKAAEEAIFLAKKEGAGFTETEELLKKIENLKP